MASRPINELLGYLLSRLSPDSRRFLFYSLGASKRPTRESGPSSSVRQSEGQKGKLLVWRHPRGVYTTHLAPEHLAEVQRHAAEFEAERLMAPEIAEELLALPSEQRAAALDRKEQFCTLALAEQLLQRSRQLSFQSPRQGRDLAELSLAIVRRLDANRYGSRVVQDLCGRAWSEIANCYRLGSDFSGAERALRKAEACVHTSADPLEMARLCNLKAALRKDQRRFEEALRLRDRAIAIFSRVQDRHSVGRTLNSKGSDYLEMGNPDAAIDCLQIAVDSLDPTLEPRIALAAFHNLILALTERGRFLKAADAHSRALQLYADADPDIRTKGEWLRGRISFGLGRLKQAELAFQTAKKEFQQRENAYDFALVSLDLALVHLRKGQTSQVRRLASEMIPIFESRQIHREALAALTLFRRAVEQETVTVDSLRKIIAQLEKAPRKA